MDANQVEEHGEEEVIRRSRANGAQADPRREQDPSSTNVARKSSVTETKDKGRNKLEEEKRSVAQWEQQAEQGRWFAGHASHVSAAGELGYLLANLIQKDILAIY